MEGRLSVASLSLEESRNNVNREAPELSSINDNASKDDSVWADSDEEVDGVSDLDREWNKRREQFYNVGYRDGISAGQNDAAQDGFNHGFKDSVMAGYKWGIIRGVTSALAHIPDDVKVKLIESEEVRHEYMNLHATVDSIGTEDTLKLFYDDLKRVKSDEKCKSVESSSSLTVPSGSKTSELENHFGKLESLLKESPIADVHLNLNQNSTP